MVLVTLGYLYCITEPGQDMTAEIHIVTHTTVIGMPLPHRTGSAHILTSMTGGHSLHQGTHTTETGLILTQDHPQNIMEDGNGLYSDIWTILTFLCACL